jgi:site-specific recombinase XerC
MWFAFCEAHDLGVLEVRRAHGDVYKRWLDLKAGEPLPAKTLARRLAAVSSWYGNLVKEGAAAFNPFERVRRPKSHKDIRHGSTRDQRRALTRTIKPARRTPLL